MSPHMCYLCLRSIQYHDYPHGFGHARRPGEIGVVSLEVMGDASLAFWPETAIMPA
jgi:hypothetical protein